MKINWTKYLYIFTILFFALGIFNITFAWLGFICMILPFVLLIRDKKKTWCQKYCPRASLLSAVYRGRKSKGRRTPEWLAKVDAKTFFLAYFGANLFILMMSTIMVFRGRIEAMDHVRFLIAFQLPWDIPQLINVPNIPDWAVHLSFRVYSMMFTTTVIGLILGWFYAPRTWCTICPINTLSDMGLKNQKEG
ncbi:MAG: hypothetical protein K0R84_77 [Clostridia bacterium]|jgi:hypothetical protein|nr:hypothetical protein [Clostridia bacterium]